MWRGFHLARILSVSERTVREWLSRMDKDAKEARNRRIFDMWMACCTQEEIATGCDCDQKTVANIVSGKTEDLPFFLKEHPSAEHRGEEPTKAAIREAVIHAATHGIRGPDRGGVE